MSDSHFIFEQTGQIARLTFNRPDVLNAFRLSMFHDLLAIIRQVREDDAVRALVLTGNGRAFSAGIDLQEQAHLFADDVLLKPAQENLALMQDITRQLVALPKPVISAINGAAVGVGAEISIASDIRLASESAYFMFAEVKRGLFETNGVMYFLPRLVGYGRALEWMLTGDRISADEALRAGLVTRVLPADELIPYAIGMAERLASNAPISVRLIKQVMGRSCDLDLEAVMGLESAGMLECAASDDFKEGVRAFNEKRAPRYTGR